MQLAGLLLALVVLVTLSLLGVDLIVITFISSIIVIVTSGLDWQTALLSMEVSSYLSKFSAYVGQWMFVMALGALFGKIMSETKSAHTIAVWVTERLGTKYCVFAIGLVTCLLTWAGISGFVIMFVIAPLALVMMKENNIPRFLLPAIITFGNVPACGTLPYSIDVTNIIPTAYLGTNLGSAPVLGIIGGLIIFACGYIYVMNCIRKSHVSMDTAAVAATFQGIEMEEYDRESWPPLWKAFMPLLVIIAVVFPAQQVMDSIPAVMLALGGACVTGLLLNWKQLEGRRASTVKEGVSSGINSLCTAAAVMGFSGVVQLSPVFPEIIEAVMNLNLNAYLKEFVAINVLSGVVGSSTSGVTIFMDNLSKRFLDMGLNPAAIHRLAPVSGCGLNSLPNGISVSITMSYTKVSYRDGYWQVFVTSVIFPLIAGAVVSVLCIAGFIC